MKFYLIQIRFFCVSTLYNFLVIVLVTIKYYTVKFFLFCLYSFVAQLFV